MPTKKQYIDKIDAEFGLIHEDGLNSYEKSVYDTYKGKTPEKALDDYLEEMSQYDNKSNNLTSYVDDLKQTDPTIIENFNKINKLNESLTKNANDLNDSLEQLSLLKQKIDKNKKEIESETKELNQARIEYDKLVSERKKLRDEKIAEVRNRLTKEANDELARQRDVVSSHYKFEVDRVSNNYNREINEKLDEINKIASPFLDGNNKLKKEDVMFKLHDKRQIFSDNIDECNKVIKEKQAEIETLNNKLNDRKFDKEKDENLYKIENAKSLIDRYTQVLNESTNQRNELEDILSVIGPKVYEIQEIEKNKEDAISEANAKLEEELAPLRKAAIVKEEEIDLAAGKAFAETEKEYYKKEYMLENKIEDLSSSINRKNFEIEKVPGAIKVLEDQVDRLNKEKLENEQEKSKLEKDNLNHAKKINDENIKNLFKSKHKLDQYGIIYRAINNDKPIVSADAVVNGLTVVKTSYQEYYGKHNFLGRIFKFLPFTSAHADYQKYAEVRDKFINNSNIDKNDIDKYLDKNVIGGSLLKYTDELGDDKTNNLINTASKDSFLEKKEEEFGVLQGENLAVAKNDKLFNITRVQVDPEILASQMEETEDQLENSYEEEQLEQEKALNNEENTNDFIANGK